MISKRDDPTIVLLQKLLKQAAWRTQYRIRTQLLKESCCIIDNKTCAIGFEEEVISEMYVNELLEEVPWKKSRYIIQRVVIDEMTEKDVAYELKISQQGVNKWKKKGLDLMQQNFSRLYK